jgi:DNA ligase-1
MDYIQLTDLYEKLEATSKRLEKTKLLSEFLKNCPKKEIDRVMLLVQGLVFPKADERKIGVASKLIVKALNLATGLTANDIEKSWKKTGDLGLTAEELIKKKRQHTLFSQDLTIQKVFDNIQKLASIEGIGSTDVKLKVIAELLTSAKPKEARYIVRTVLEDLRVGLGEGTLRDAIAIAYYERHGGKLDLESKDPSFGAESELARIRDAIQEAYDVTNDYASVAQMIIDQDLEVLKALELDTARPLKVMLAQKAKDVREAFEVVGRPAAIEYKYDGFRMLIGKHGDKVTIHTRRLENVTAQFPEVAKLVRENIKTESCIIDCEAVGYDPQTKKYVPFQNISQRIKRKYDIEAMAKEIPVELNIFDIVYYNGKSMIKEPFKERRKILEKIVKPKEYHIRLAEQVITDKDGDAEKFYKKSLGAGNEGVMFKNLESPYKPGSRVGYMVKLKPVMETLDLVIVGAEWGEGKRAGWLTSFTVAVYDEDTDTYLEIGKFGTGIKEKKDEETNIDGVSFNELTQLLKPLIINEKGREVFVKPEIVIELKFEEIQKSPSYSSGFALRFPRLVRVRDDRRPDEASTLAQVEGFYKEQYK